ncbi:hypothetical protein QR680_017264 [Steinernema hermaphroditum]|uniref:Phosphatidylinositol-4,5-bisphosphate 4-phosphatase n=1 Tax=Steinernema hermaphroditum TaxID=289476 RepID=A0AA39LNZ0_9BILA|nr:hypothetical protein QR680_017264 [Steinernema hermaphroditum]
MSRAEDGESQPLLGSAVGLASTPQGYMSNEDDVNYENETVESPGSEPVQPIQNQPGSPDAVRGGPTVHCRVCESVIYIEGKTQQHVVRCPHCQEATPIRAAPPGKKYVRCPCNCLLICKASSNRIACPRNNCRRVITFGGSQPIGTAIRAPAGTCRVLCAHCNDEFMFNTLNNTTATCPHCKKVSSVGHQYARYRAALYLIASVVFLVAAVGLTWVTVDTAHGNPILYALWTALYLIAILLFIRFLYFATLKISQIIGPV